MDQLNVAQPVASQSKNCKLAHEVICENVNCKCDMTSGALNIQEKNVRKWKW